MTDQENFLDLQLTPEQWCARYDLRILDPDGWRGLDAPSWDAPIGPKDFLHRYWRCTVDGSSDGSTRLANDVMRATFRWAHEGHQEETGDEPSSGSWCRDCTDRLDFTGAQPGTVAVVDYPCPPLLARLGIRAKDHDDAWKQYGAMMDRALYPEIPR